MKYLSLLTIMVLLFFYSSFKPQEGKDFSIITYNVWNGFESETQRRDTFVQWARQQNVDMIAFQELNNFTQASFVRLAESWGHPYAIISKENGYPVGISSRYPITNVHRLMDGMHHGCLYAEVNGINFFVVHFSPFNSAKRRQEANAVIHTLKKKNKLNKQTIVLGDFNAFSPHDSLFYAGSGIRDSMYIARKKNNKLQNLNDKDELDYEVVRSFLTEGFYDGFSFSHENFEASYPSRVFPSVTQSDHVRIDHILISDKLKKACKEVKIIKDSVTDVLSDHYPLKVVLRYNAK